jgi:hypothetical protein
MGKARTIYAAMEMRHELIYDFLFAMRGLRCGSYIEKLYVRHSDLRRLVVTGDHLNPSVDIEVRSLKPFLSSLPTTLVLSIWCALASVCSMIVFILSP